MVLVKLLKLQSLNCNRMMSQMKVASTCLMLLCRVAALVCLQVIAAASEDAGTGLHQISTSFACTSDNTDVSIVFLDERATVQHQFSVNVQMKKYIEEDSEVKLKKG